MSGKTAFSALFICVLATAVLFSCAKKTVVLEYKYTKGEKQNYVMKMTGEGTTRIGGLPGQGKDAPAIPLKMDMNFRYRTLVTDVDAKGIADIETYLETFKSVTESGGMKMQMEADKDGARMIQGETVVKDAPGLEGLSKLFDKPTATKVDKRGKIISLTEPPSAISLPNTDLFNLIKQAQVTLPEGPVAVGTSWKEKRDMMLGEGINQKLKADTSLKFDATYTLKGMVSRQGRQCAKLEMKGEIKAKDMEIGIPRAEGSPMAMKAVFDNLDQKVKGTIYFDPNKGQLVAMEMEIDQDIAMTMSMAQGEKSLEFKSGTKMKMKVDLSLVE